MSIKTKLKSSTAASKSARADELPPFGAYSIPAFCRAHAISVSFFHKLMRAGKGPVVMRIGMRTLISAEAAETWRRQREADVTGKTITARENSWSPTAA